MPTARIDKSPPIDEKSGWRDTLQLYVPIDDEHEMSIRIHLIPLTGEEGEQFLQRRRAWFASGGQEHAVDLAYKVLDGELYIEDLYALPNASKIHWATVEDDITQMGQDPIVDRRKDHLGASDAGVVMWRTLWMRELKALAEGRPLTQWQRPETFEVTIGAGIAYGEVVEA
jgi:5,5'-dehydrodivanillate O-demethylase